MQKRGQVTIFIIIGIIISFSAAGLYLIKDQFFQNQTIQDTLIDTSSVKGFVESCLQKTLKDAVIHIGINGGYNKLPDQSSTNADLNAPYYLFHHESNIPSKEIVEIEISKYVEEFMPFCINNFETFTNEITFKEMKAQSKINNNNVATTLSFPIKIIKNQKETNLNSFKKQTPSSLNNALLASNEIINYSLVFQNSLCLDCLEDTSQNNNLKIRSLELNIEEFFYVMEDENDKDFIFRFATKYDSNTYEQEDELIDFSLLEGLTIE